MLVHFIGYVQTTRSVTEVWDFLLLLSCSARAEQLQGSCLCSVLRLEAVEMPLALSAARGCWGRPFVPPGAYLQPWAAATGLCR